ncbi:uncharacterized protein SCHCODRAFT_02514908 [Schizophyllum commune H4-8]|nr:uncharacterized protein SCHCODRAFT_02514908 [Schizophyllum commune H4-8]KAI5887585.1 hypothetical protein SCHCODRAFT_02514908 [Schizophyllum commune H4-8]
MVDARRSRMAVERAARHRQRPLLANLAHLPEDAQRPSLWTIFVRLRGPATRTSGGLRINALRTLDIVARPPYRSNPWRLDAALLALGSRKTSARPLLPADARPVSAHSRRPRRTSPTCFRVRLSNTARRGAYHHSCRDVLHRPKCRHGRLSQVDACRRPPRSHPTRILQASLLSPPRSSVASDCRSRRVSDSRPPSSATCLHLLDRSAMTFPLHAALPLQLWSLPSSSAVVVPEFLCRFKTKRKNRELRARVWQIVNISTARPSNIGGSGSGSMSSDSDRRGSSSGSGAVGGHRTSSAGPIVETCSTPAVSPPGESGALTGEFATSVTVDSPRPAQRSATRTKNLNVIAHSLISQAHFSASPANAPIYHYTWPSSASAFPASPSGSVIIGTSAPPPQCGYLSHRPSTTLGLANVLRAGLIARGALSPPFIFSALSLAVSRAKIIQLIDAFLGASIIGIGKEE